MVNEEKLPPEEELPIVEPPKPPTDKMLVFEDGVYETGYWLSKDSYPAAVCYVIEADSELAAKIRTLYPYFTLVVENGELVGVTARDKTQEEIDRENAPPPKTPEQIRIEQLENKLAASEQSNLDTMDALFDIYLMVLDLQLGGEQP